MPIVRVITRASIVLMLLILPACIDTKKAKIQTNYTQECQARYFDIPTIGDSVPLFEATENGITVSYQTELSFEEIEQFYNSEMECFGWQSVWRYSGKELLLTFEKPSRWLTVSARVDKKLNLVVIVSSPK